MYFLFFLIIILLNHYSFFFFFLLKKKKKLFSTIAYFQGLLYTYVNYIEEYLKSSLLIWIVDISSSFGYFIAVYVCERDRQILSLHGKAIVKIMV